MVSADPPGRERLAALVAEQPDCAVVGPADPDEAVLLSPQGDVVLWDPGLDTSGEWRGGASDEPGLPVVVLGPPGRAAEAIAAGARGYLTRDVDAPTLGAALRAVAAGLQVIDPARAAEMPADDTVKFHVNTIMGKLGAQTRTEAVTRAARKGLIIL